MSTDTYMRHSSLPLLVKALIFAAGKTYNFTGKYIVPAENIKTWTNTRNDAVFRKISLAILYDVTGSITEIRNHSKSWTKMV